VQSIVLSKKGMDSRAGKMYSPVDSETGEYVFLPIPDSRRRWDNKISPEVEYAQLPTRFLKFKNLKEILSIRNKLPVGPAHLDPDLVNIRPEIKTWRPAFGQEGSAQGYLRNLGIGEDVKGVIFLFYSRFKPWGRKKTNFLEGYYIFGWLEVDYTLIPDHQPHPLNYHPHFQPHHREDKNNIIYVASNKLTGTNIPGAGLFNRLSKNVRLSYYNTGNLRIMLLPSSALNGFSFLQNYQQLNEKYCW